MINCADALPDLAAYSRLPALRSQRLGSGSVSPANMVTHGLARRHETGRSYQRPDAWRLAAEVSPRRVKDGCGLAQGWSDAHRAYSSTRAARVCRAVSGWFGGLPQRRQCTEQRAFESSLGHARIEHAGRRSTRHENRPADPSRRRNASEGEALRRGSDRHQNHAAHARIRRTVQQRVRRDPDDNRQSQNLPTARVALPAHGGIR